MVYEYDHISKEFRAPIPIWNLTEKETKEMFSGERKMNKDQISYLLNHLRDYKKTIQMDMEYYGYPRLKLVLGSINKCIEELERNKKGL